MSTLIEKSKEESSIAADCHPCVINQTRSACRFAELTEEQTERIIHVAKAHSVGIAFVEKGNP